MAAMYGMIAAHASFGDIELAQMALRGRLACALNVFREMKLKGCFASMEVRGMVVRVGTLCKLGQVAGVVEVEHDALLRWLLTQNDQWCLVILG
jgi:hypothetical protein